MTAYGEIKRIHDEVWSHAYRFHVKTGVRLVDISLPKHIPLHMKIGHRALISYVGQPMTCYRCNEQGHQISECPLRKVPGSQQTSHDTNSWANMVKRGIERAASIVNNGNDDDNNNNNASLSLTKEAQVVRSQPCALDHDEQNEHDTISVGHHLCLLADNETPLSNDVKNLDETLSMDDELLTTPLDKQTTCPTAPTWSHLIAAEPDAGRAHEKQGKKREKSKQTKENKQRDKESDYNNCDAGITLLSQTTSPKRTKKSK